MSDQQDKEIRWIQNPQHILEAAKVIAGYLKSGDGVPLSNNTVYRAYRLLGLSRINCADGSSRWHMPKDWDQRVKAAGVNPKTFEIEDPTRWNLAAEQLKKFRFSPIKLEERYIKGDFAVEATPFLAEVPHRKAGQKLEAKTKEQKARDDYLSEQLSKKYGPG